MAVQEVRVSNLDGYWIILCVWVVLAFLFSKNISDAILIKQDKIIQQLEIQNKHSEKTAKTLDTIISKVQGF